MIIDDRLSAYHQSAYFSLFPFSLFISSANRSDKNKNYKLCAHVSASIFALKYRDYRAQFFPPTLQL